MHLAREGFASVRHVASGEVMHARTPPMVEAESLYVDQSGLAERLRLGPAESASDAPPLVLWDVGLGAGANAMAAIRCYEQTAALHPVRALEIISFENDLDSLRLAFAHRHHFPYLRHSAPAGLLGSGRWRSSTGAGLSWRLVEGDVFETVMEVMPRPDLVFYDLFSGRTHAEAWTLASFRRLFEAFGARDAELFTYTASTAARVAMLGAGFLVATGRATDDKPESTIAFTPRALDHGRARRHDLLGADWLDRWKRSGARYPSDLPEADRGEFEEDDPAARAVSWPSARERRGEGQALIAFGHAAVASPGIRRRPSCPATTRSTAGSSSRSPRSSPPRPRPRAAPGRRAPRSTTPPR